MLHRVKKWSGLKAWATKVAQRQGNKRATVALARKMAVVLHRIVAGRHELPPWSGRHRRHARRIKPTP